MLKNQIEDPVNRRYLDSQGWEIVRNVYQTIHTSGLYKFTLVWTDALYSDLDAVFYDLEHLPPDVSMEFLEVAEHLQAARNELRLARFLFDVQEIHPLYRLVMRNRAVLRGECILSRLIDEWPRP